MTRRKVSGMITRHHRRSAPTNATAICLKLSRLKSSQLHRTGRIRSCTKTLALNAHDGLLSDRPMQHP